jgi:hypothetical protein
MVIISAINTMELFLNMEAKKSKTMKSPSKSTSKHLKIFVHKLDFEAVFLRSLLLCGSYPERRS